MAAVEFIHCGVKFYVQWQVDTLEDGRKVRSVRCPVCGTLVKLEVLGEEALSHV